MVVVQSPQGNQVIKRVIGFAGDTIMIKDGEVYLNGDKLNEQEYINLNSQTYGDTFLADGKTVTVPANSYFV